MPTMALPAMLEELGRFVEDDKQVVTYQWLSRKLEVASDTSKRCELPLRANRRPSRRTTVSRSPRAPPP